MTINKKSTDAYMFNFLAYGFTSIVAIVCFLPFFLVISGSFSSETSIVRDGFRIIPKEISLLAYRAIFTNPDNILRAYGVTITITLVGASLSLFLITMTAYVLSRKDFRYRNLFAFYFYFTTLFSGGLVPWYILMVRYLGMKNSLLALIIPLLFNVFYMIVVRSFMSTIPESISESAKIDGANDFRIYIQLILPLSKPVMATIGLFIALNYWNDWFNAMLFIENSKMVPLQYYLYRILSMIEILRNAVDIPNVSNIELPSESFKMSMTIVTIGPIMLLYPYLQKYFIKGIMVGAVKG